ncbi:MAG: helix-turn-helix domain-containing protein [Chlamydiae bacterium]|nr:helix-turn-helix domain-containing protein [Chlamydiota bacterium]
MKSSNVQGLKYLKSLTFKIPESNPVHLTKVYHPKIFQKLFKIVYNKIMMKNVFLTATEAAARLGITKSLMARYCREKRLKQCLKKGHTWFIPLASFDRFKKIQGHYSSGRPQKIAPYSIFWREQSIPSKEEMIPILFRRAPQLIPKMIPRSVAEKYVRKGRTLLERIFRKSLIRGLYEKNA